MNTKYFYVEVIKKNEVNKSWYNKFLGEVFLVRNDSKNKGSYILADGYAWIDKKDASRIEVNTWRPTD